MYMLHPHFLHSRYHLGNGIGRVIARSFAKAGAAGVHIADINGDAARAASEDIASVATNPDFKALASVVDVSKEADVKEMINLTKLKFGRLDYAVNNAGVRLLLWHLLRLLTTY